MLLISPLCHALRPLSFIGFSLHLQVAVKFRRKDVSRLRFQDEFSADVNLALHALDDQLSEEGNLFGRTKMKDGGRAVAEALQPLSGHLLVELFEFERVGGTGGGRTAVGRPARAATHRPHSRDRRGSAR